MRIVSICPSNTELASCLGLTGQLVGVDDFSDWPEEIASLPKVGPDLSIDMDKVEELKPDLILASLSVPGMEKNIEELEKRNLPYVVYNPQSLDDIANDLLHLGEITGIPEKAAEYVQNYRNRLSAFKEAASNRKKKPRIYFEWWPNPIFTPGRVNWLTEISKLAGASNIFEDVDLASVQTDWEDVLKRDPDYIFLAWVGVKQSRMKIEHVLKRANAEKAKAVKEKQIHLLEEALYCRPSPRLLEGLEKLAQILK
ncbi:cobalamin-binding protein [Metabacillus sp. RGM 3146]|uniref:cobalamin-binding protein n=1 Tax=Metabacillus sp. RGM 3146 TaxID=3401092 RepID=UPI003B9B8DB5